MDNYFLNRHTWRTFSDREVTDNLLQDMLEAASHAPTTGNMQLYSVVITRDVSQKKLLAPAHFSQPASLNANVILTFCADLNRFVKWCENREADPGFDNFQSLMAAFLDTTILAQQFVTIAEREGLGTCYLGTTTYNADKISEVLHLPRRVIPVISVAVGYPSGQYEETDRLEPAAFIHKEKYNDYTSDDINRIYKDKEQRQDSKRFVQENNKQSLAQVFTDVRYPRKNNEYFSSVFINFLKSQGFMLD
ncbi:MAG: nitroreductase family protein [Muribaculaceae bacterium]|nr:nitroreductase family protein [Muribaculaceae bacterium]